MDTETLAKTSTLGQKTTYHNTYHPEHLFFMPRVGKREELGIDEQNLPFKGVDIWNHYEVSWLDTKGKPIVALATLQYDCTSPNIVESKSLKLYFNSLNQTQFDSFEAVEKIISQDLSAGIGTRVQVQLAPLSQQGIQRPTLEGICIDDLDIACDTYTVDSNLLQTGDTDADESLHSHLLRSNCLVTGQPDWATVCLHYRGKQINHDSLLRYIVSYRNHTEFGEQCVERMFSDIMQTCQPESLTITARYTRRGGIDINPWRSTEDTLPQNLRTIRQ